MDRLGDLGLNLLAAVIGFTVASIRTRINRMIRVYRARRFWLPFIEGDLYLVLAVFDDVQHIEWERSGLAGIGDVKALTELQQHLADIRIAKQSLEYGHTIAGQRLRDNLVLIGGADSNRVTALAMNRLPLTIVFNDPTSNDVAFLDRTDGTVMKPVTSEQGELTRDQGIVIRADNPFNADNKVLIVAGSYGFGSIAAVRLVTSQKFLREPIVRAGENFEAFFTTEIIEGSPQEPSLQIIRQLAQA